MEKVIIDTFIEEIKKGNLKLEDIPLEWKTKVENAMA